MAVEANRQVEIRTLGDDHLGGAELAWQRFVEEWPDASLYHTLTWRDLVQSVFRHEPQYLMAYQGNRVTGLLPLFRVRAPMLGRKLISLPYDAASGGPLAVDAESERALAEAAVRRAGASRDLFLQLRCSEERPALCGLGAETTRPVVVSDVALEDGDQVWKRIAPNQRRSLGQALRRGVRVREARDAADYRDFYRVYLRTFRSFGTPPYRFDYFEAIRQSLGSKARLLIAEVGSRCVAGLLLFNWRHRSVCKFAVALPDYVGRQVYAALYGRAIDTCLEEHIKQLSWGASSTAQTGLIAFKERWGAVTRPVATYTWSVAGTAPKLEAYFDTNHPARRLWRQLPLPLTRMLGGILNRWYC